MLMKKLIVILVGIFVANVCHAQHRGITDTLQSPQVKFKSIGVGDCRWTSGFWADKFELCEQVMVPHMDSLLTRDSVKMSRGS